MKQDARASAAQVTDGLLRLVLQRELPQDVALFDTAGRRTLLAAAKTNVVLVRATRRLSAHGYAPDPGLVAAADGESVRIARALSIMETIDRVLRDAKLLFAFPKAGQHYPDMGHDIDLLLSAPEGTVPDLLGDHLPLQAETTSRTHQWAGKSAYRIQGEATELEVHHRRLGHFGEHVEFATQALDRRVASDVGGSAVVGFCAEDQLILQALQRMYGHLSFRVSDVVAGAVSLTGSRLDWDRVLRVSSASGLLAGIRRYVGAINFILTTSGLDEIDPRTLPHELRGARIAVERSAGIYRIAVGTVAVPLFARALASAAVHGYWRRTARLLLLPPVAGIRRAALSLSRG